MFSHIVSPGRKSPSSCGETLKEHHSEDNDAAQHPANRIVQPRVCSPRICHKDLTTEPDGDDRQDAKGNRNEHMLPSGKKVVAQVKRK